GNSKVTLVTSGTELSIYTLDSARSAGSFVKSPGSDLDAFEYMEFPGWTGRESIEAYIAGLRNLLPTEDAKLALDRLLQPEAIEMMTERLVGRFRPVVTAIERIIGDGSPDGWQDAIHLTESRLVSYKLCTKPGNLCRELIRLENKYRENLDVMQHRKL
ncbi:hypothetical protein BGX30_008083, partial [Mortierella sp. GBA39]